MNEEERLAEEQRREKEYREKQREENEIIIRAILNSVSNIFNRQKHVDDPVIRYSLFVDKLSMSLDIILGILTSVLHNEKNPYSDDILEQTQKVSKLIQDELINLMNYVRLPSYSPDAPYGKNLVKNMSETFHEQYYHHPTDKNLE